MRFLEALKMAGSAVWAHKLRSFLTLLGIIFGVAVVILVVTMVEGFNKYIEDKVADLGSNAFVVTRFGIITSEKEYREKEQYNRAVTTSEMEAILAHPTFVKDAAAVTRRRVPVKVGDKQLEDIRLAGVSPSMVNIDTVKVATGRYFSHEEDEQRAPVAFIGADVAKELFPTSDPLGKEMKVDGRIYRVVGVADVIGSVFGQSQDSFINIPIGSFQKAYGSQSQLALRVQAIDGPHMQAAVDEVRQVLRARRHLDPAAKDNFDVITPDSINNLRDQLFGTISLVAIAVTSIALVVGGIVVMNIMLVSVTERTREIGIRKSLGAKRVDILKQFLAESTLLSLVGGVIGVVTAWGLSKLVTVLFSFPTALPVLWTLIALGVSAGVGLFFGIYPAWQAAKLDPIDALRAD